MHGDKAVKGKPSFLAGGISRPKLDKMRRGGVGEGYASFWRR